MSRNESLCRHWLRCSSASLLPLILVVSLAACGQQAVATHTFAGKVQVISVPTPYQIPMSIALGPDGNLWFPAIAYNHFGTSQPGGAIGRVMLDGKLRLYFLPSNCYPSYITRGSDGKLWFLATQGQGQVSRGVDTLPGFSQNTAEIGSITPTGQLHLIPLPTLPQRALDSITVGPDGNLWFTDLVSPDLSNVQAPRAFDITRMTPLGKITDFPLSPSTDSPHFIFAGPGGNMWFSIASTKGQNAHSKLGRITPQGQITVFDLPDNISDVASITSGSDGNLWLSGDGYILRVTPQGKVKEFLLATLAGIPASDQSGAFALTSGPDGTIWFLSNLHWVGRMTTSGVLKQYPYPKNVDFPVFGQYALLSSIFGSDGTLWIADGDRLAHFV